MRTRNAQLFTAIAVAACAASSADAAFLSTFNSANELTSNYSVNIHSTSNNPYTQVTTSGLSDSGRVALTAQTGDPTFDNNDATAIYTGTGGTFDPSAGSITVSGYYLHKAVGATKRPTFAIFQIGIAGATSTEFKSGTDAADDFLTFRLRTQDSNTTSNTVTSYQLEFQTGNNGSLTSTGASSIAGGTSALTAGNWYFLTTTITRHATTSGRFDVTGGLYNAASDGTVGSLLHSINSGTNGLTANTADIWNDTTVFAGFRGANNPGNNGIDNFAAVPEPTALGALATGLMFLPRRRRGV